MNQVQSYLIEINGISLTEKGKELFEKIEPSINILQKTELEFLGLRDINFGTYNTMNSKILSNSINKYYEKNKNTNITTATTVNNILRINSPNE